METLELTSVTPALQKFIKQCDARGYKNNNSLTAMKFEWCLHTGGMWHATYKDNDIISLSGVHPFEDGYRALFRGAQLESRPAGLNKHHMSSWCFYAQLPHQIEWANGKPLYVTTNVNNDASGKMNKINKLFGLLEKQNIVEHTGQDEVFFTLQNIWRINVDEYLRVRR